MRNALAIAQKECRVYLTTWTSYILFAAFLLITAFFFQRLVIEFQLRSIQFMEYQAEGVLDDMNLTDWVIGPLLLNIMVFFLFMVPILTMRLFAEERRTKTLELLMTVPIRPTDIVVGKYLSAVAMVAMMLGLTLVFPLLLHAFGGSVSGGSPVDWSSIGTGYLGLLLLGSAFAAVGLLASSVTESQIIAVIVGFAALLLFYVIGLAARGQSGFWREFLEYLSLTNHIEPFVRGIVRVSDVVYCVSLATFSLFLTYRVVEAQRWR